MAATSEGQYLRRLAYTTLAVLVVLVLWRSEDVFLLLFLAGLIAIVLRAISHPIRNHTPLSEQAAVIVATLLVVLAFGLLGWFFVPRLIEQAEQFTQKLPEIIELLRGTAGRLPFVGERLDEVLAGIDVQAGSGTAGGEASEGSSVEVPAMEAGASEPEASETLDSALDVASSLLWGGILFLYLVFAALFLALTPHLYRRGILLLVPKTHEQRAKEVIDTITTTLRSWLLGQLVVMAIVGTLVSLGLWALGVPLALLLGFIAGVLEFVPMLGPIAATVPAVLVGLTVGPLTALYVIVLFFAVQQLESYLITPLVQKRAVHLPPVITITVVLVMHILFGISGAIVAVPFMVVVMILVKMLYVEDALGKNASID